MKKFDYDSIFNRLFDNVRKRFSWSRILPNSVKVRLIEAIAEEQAELSRYNEYLTRESKWDLAQNTSSLFYQAKLLGYSPHRKKGATGIVEVSSNNIIFSDSWVPFLTYEENSLVRHDNRAWRATSINSLSEPSEANPDWERVKTFHSFNIGIPKYTQFEDQEGNPFVSVENTTLSSSDDFVKVKIVQGELRRNQFIGKGLLFEELVIEERNIEDNFYEVFVNDIKWSEINNLRESLGEENVFQVINSPTYDSVTFRFGDGVTGKKLEMGDSIRIDWIETQGEIGNSSTQGSITNIQSPLPDTQGNLVELFCFNYDAIVGGQDEEEAESIRRNGTFAFQAGDRLVSTIDYKAFVESNFDFISKAVVWGAYEINLDNNNDPWTWIPPNENMIFISAITPGNNPLDFKKNPDGTLNESNISQVIKETLPRKSPSDIVKFEDVEFIYLTTNSVLLVENENYLLPEVEEEIRNLLIETYGARNMQFMQSIFESNYLSLIDKQESIRYHNTEFSFYKKTTFGSSFEFTGILPLFEIEPNSIRLVAETVEGTSVFQFATDNGSGNFTSETGYTLAASSAINYNTGSIFFEVESGLSLDPSQYVLKIYYDSVSKDIRPKKRNQILILDEQEIFLSSSYYTGE